MDTKRQTPSPPVNTETYDWDWEDEWLRLYMINKLRRDKK